MFPWIKTIVGYGGETGLTFVTASSPIREKAYTPNGGSVYPGVSDVPLNAMRAVHISRQRAFASWFAFGVTPNLRRQNRSRYARNRFSGDAGWSGFEPFSYV